jgi:hypothetical protein
MKYLTNSDQLKGGHAVKETYVFEMIHTLYPDRRHEC